MKTIKETLLTAFALFSLFFGAGNLILPPFLGFNSGNLWWLVTLGFCVSAVLIPILGIIAHSRLQGTMFDFAKKVSPAFSLVYCFMVYAISIALPSPRTASVTHEMAISPLLGSSGFTTSLTYFLLVWLFAMNRSRILDIIGRWLTPAILLVLVLIIGSAFLDNILKFDTVAFQGVFTNGILEGYQTFDAIGAVVVGGVILVSLNLKEPAYSYLHKRRLVARAGWVAGAGLFLIYSGLIYTGAIMHPVFDPQINRTDLLAGIGTLTLGPTGRGLFAVLVSFACFTTAVGIVTGTADFVKSRFPGTPWVYGATAFLGSVIGVLVGQFNVGYIIAIALPALMFIYPLTITLILLNIVPDRYTAPAIFRWVVYIVLLFSVPDFLKSIGWDSLLGHFPARIPMNEYSMGWVLPGFLTFLLGNLVRRIRAA